MLSSFSTSTFGMKYFKPPLNSLPFAPTGVQILQRSGFVFPTNISKTSTLIVTNQTGGNAWLNGTYTARASSTYTDGHPNYAVGNGFNINTPAGTAPNLYYTVKWSGTINMYEVANNNGYIGNDFTTTTTGDIYGDWIEMSFPYQFALKQFDWESQQQSGMWVVEAYMLGSQNGSNWSIIGDVITGSATLFTKSFAENIESFSYYRIVTTRFYRSGRTSASASFGKVQFWS